MGIVVPRPAMRKREARRIVARLKRHAELMARREAEGWNRDEASEMAMADLLKEEAAAKGDEK